MQENEKEPGDEKLMIIPLGEESKKITRVISNDTARRIIEFLADEPLSASDIAEKLNAPLTTVVYNLENLEEVGLVKVERIKYSEKGRKVKIYAPVRKLIVVVPEKTNNASITDMLRKYMGVLLAAVLASGVIEFLGRGFGRRPDVLELADRSLAAPKEAPMYEAVPAMDNETIAITESSEITHANAIQTEDLAIDQIPAPASQPPLEGAYRDVINATPAPTPVQPGGETISGIFSHVADTIIAHPGLIFLLGCLFVITVVVVMDYYRKKK